MYTWLNFHGSSPYSFWENDQNEKKIQQKFEKSVNRKNRSMVSIDGSFDLHSSRCLHDPSFMALALIVCEQWPKRKTRQKVAKSVNRKK